MKWWCSNLANSKLKALRRLQVLADRRLTFVQGDIRDATALDSAFAHGVDAVVHFAGLKAVGESVAKPLDYYENNVQGTLGLLQAMKRHGVKRLVFSSSATVYGDPHGLPSVRTFLCRRPIPMAAAS